MERSLQCSKKVASTLSPESDKSKAHYALQYLSSRFSSTLPANILYTFLISPMRHTSLPTTPSFKRYLQTVWRSLTLSILLFSTLFQHRQTTFFTPRYDTVTKVMPGLYMGLKTRTILNWNNLNLISLLEKWGLNLSFSMKSQIERYSQRMIQFSCLSAWYWRGTAGWGEGRRWQNTVE
jgi:hypothetical protein